MALAPHVVRANDRDEATAREGDAIDFAQAVAARARRIHVGVVAGDRLLIEQEAGALIYGAARFLRQLAPQGPEAA